MPSYENESFNRDELRTYGELYSYYKAPNYYNEEGYYSSLYGQQYFDGYGYNYYYGNYGYYEYSRPHTLQKSSEFEISTFLKTLGFMVLGLTLYVLIYYKI